jgi:hypothetical protein
MGSATVATVTADEGDGFWMAIEEAAHAQPVHAEPGLRWGHPETLDADVHAQVMGVDLDTEHIVRSARGTRRQVLTCKRSARSQTRWWANQTARMREKTRILQARTRKT